MFEVRSTKAPCSPLSLWLWCEVSPLSAILKGDRRAPWNGAGSSLRMTRALLLAGAQVTSTFLNDWRLFLIGQCGGAPPHCTPSDLVLPPRVWFPAARRRGLCRAVVRLRCWHSPPGTLSTQPRHIRSDKNLAQPSVSPLARHVSDTIPGTTPPTRPVFDSYTVHFLPGLLATYANAVLAQFIALGRRPPPKVRAGQMVLKKRPHNSKRPAAALNSWEFVAQLQAWSPRVVARRSHAKKSSRRVAPTAQIQWRVSSVVLLAGGRQARGARAH